jgi:hypothetical protein
MDAASEDLEAAFEDGFEAARRGEEAMPGCTANARGRAWLEGYLAAFDRPSDARIGQPGPDP